MNDKLSIASELLRSGADLWSAVQCDVRGDCVLIYAELTTDPKPAVCDVLLESKRLVREVLQRRLGRGDRLARVHWNGRISYTFAPDSKD